MKKINSRRLLIILGLILLALFISSSMSYEHQSLVSVLKHLFPAKPFENKLRLFSFDYAGVQISIKSLGYYKFVEFFIRKTAHFLTFLLISLVLCNILGKTLRKNLLTSIIVILAVISIVGIDELHQLITGGRTPLVQDVLLDTFGGVVGMICYFINGRITRTKH